MEKTFSKLNTYHKPKQSFFVSIIKHILLNGNNGKPDVDFAKKKV